MTNNPELIDLAMQLAQQDDTGAFETPEHSSAEEPVTDQVPPSPEHVFAASDLQQRAVTKEFRTADELAAMILSDLKQLPGCPADGVNVTVYGLSPFNSWLSFGVAAGPVHNKAELQQVCTILTERLRVRYDIRAE